MGSEAGIGVTVSVTHRLLDQGSQRMIWLYLHPTQGIEG